MPSSVERSAPAISESDVLSVASLCGCFWLISSRNVLTSLASSRAARTDRARSFSIVAT